MVEIHQTALQPLASTDGKNHQTLQIETTPQGQKLGKCFVYGNSHSLTNL